MFADSGSGGLLGRLWRHMLTASEVAVAHQYHAPWDQEDTVAAHGGNAAAARISRCRCGAGA